MTTDESWTYGYCESCLRNAHEKVKMVKIKIKSGDPEGKHSKEMWVCTQCGSTRWL